MFSKLESFRGIILLGDLFASFSSLLLDIARAGCVDTPQKKISETRNSQVMFVRKSLMRTRVVQYSKSVSLVWFLILVEVPLCFFFWLHEILPTWWKDEYTHSSSAILLHRACAKNEKKKKKRPRQQ